MLLTCSLLVKKYEVLADCTESMTHTSGRWHDIKLHVFTFNAVKDSSKMDQQISFQPEDEEIFLRFKDSLCLCCSHVRYWIFSSVFSPILRTMRTRKQLPYNAKRPAASITSSASCDGICPLKKMKLCIIWILNSSTLMRNETRWSWREQDLLESYPWLCFMSAVSCNKSLLLLRKGRKEEKEKTRRRRRISQEHLCRLEKCAIIETSEVTIQNIQTGNCGVEKVPMAVFHECCKLH